MAGSIIRPFRRDEKGDFANAAGPDLLGSALGQLLGTRGSSVHGPGELPWRPEFGSRLHLLRHEARDHVLQNVGATYVREAVARFDPRAVVTFVDVARTVPRGDTVRVRIRWHPRGRPHDGEDTAVDVRL